MKINILYYLIFTTLTTCYSSQSSDPHYDFWKGKNTVYVDAKPIYEPNTGNDKHKVVKKEKIIIANNIVESIYDQLKARNASEKEAHYAYLLTSKNARAEHEKELIEQTQIADYHEFNEMLSDWAIGDVIRNGPVEKAIWEDQEKPKKLLSYVLKGTVGVAGVAFAGIKLFSASSLAHSSYIAGLVSATLPAVSLASRDMAYLFEQKAVEYLRNVPLEVFNSNTLQEGFHAFLEQARHIDGQQLPAYTEAFIRTIFNR